MLDLSSVSATVQEVVPYGLILNELASNTIKHAFRGRDAGQVTVSLRDDADRTVHLGVRDDGVGLPTGLDWRQTTSLGLRLVVMLTEQLGGTIEAQSVEGGGSLFDVSFRVPGA